MAGPVGGSVACPVAALHGPSGRPVGLCPGCAKGGLWRERGVCEAPFHRGFFLDCSFPPRRGVPVLKSPPPRPQLAAYSRRPNGRDAARKQRFGLAVRCALLAQQFAHCLLIDWLSALHFAEEAVDEVRRPLSCW